ncbi:MAG: hypothetical protein L3K04_01475 [Thermoplasmata archaeon]|nr:hypothetical protein [Thermoplasmata archaeon]
MAFVPVSHRLRRVLPGLLAAGMLAVLLTLALAPATGAVRADSSCQYGNCSSPSNGVPVWAWGAVGGLLFLIILLMAVLVFRHRRRGSSPPSTAVPPDAGVAATMGPEDGGPEAPYDAMGPAGAAAVPAAAPAYLETEDDVAAPPTVMPSAAVPTPPPAAGVGGEEPNIDSLMDELDRISGEILKKEPKGKGPPPSPTDNPPEDTG